MIEALPPLVVHVIHHLKIGGMENTLVNLINHTPPGRVRHAVVCVEDFSDFRQRIARPDVEVVALHRSQVGVMALRRALYGLFRRWRPAIVHTRNSSGLDALLPAFLARVPVRVHSEHGWDVDNLDGSKFKPALLRRLHAPLVSRYITVSQDLARFLTDKLGIAPARVQQIYNGVDTQRFHPRDAAEASPLPAGFAGAGQLCIGTVGRAQAVKDQACLLRAVSLLLQSQPHLRATVRVVIVGDGPLLPALRDQVQALGLQDIAWLPGASDQVQHIMRALDVFVLPSLNEGVSNTVLEAMASGLPVLASRVGGNPELVAAGVCGELFASGDAQTLCTLLAAYCANPALRAAHARAAREQVQQHFSMQAMVGQYLHLYTGLAARDKRP